MIVILTVCSGRAKKLDSAALASQPVLIAGGGLEGERVFLYRVRRAAIWCIMEDTIDGNSAKLLPRTIKAWMRYHTTVFVTQFLATVSAMMSNRDGR